MAMRAPRSASRSADTTHATSRSDEPETRESGRPGPRRDAGAARVDCSTPDADVVSLDLDARACSLLDRTTVHARRGAAHTHLSSHHASQNIYECCGRQPPTMSVHTLLQFTVPQPEPRTRVPTGSEEKRFRSDAQLSRSPPRHTQGSLAYRCDHAWQRPDTRSRAAGDGRSAVCPDEQNASRSPKESREGRRSGRAS